LADPRAVVVGAGLGGLAAAVAMARAGHPVTLIERGARPGGYAVAFQRGGFRFDPALHVTAGGGPGGEFRRMADELGLAVEFVRLARGFDIRLGERRIDLPNDWRGFFDTLAALAPAERRGLDDLRRDLERHAPAYRDLFDPSVSRLRTVPPFLPRLPRFLRHALLPAADYLASFVRDPATRALLFAPAVFMGLPPSRFPALTWQMMTWILLSGGMYTIRGGGQALTDALTARLRESGGELVTGVEVARIDVRGGRAVGVTTGDGRCFPAGAVVSAVSLPATLDLLAGAGQAMERHRRNLAGLAPSTSTLVLSCGLACDPAEAGIESHITLAFPDADLERIMAGSDPPGASFSLVAPGLTDPAGASPSPRSVSVVAAVAGAAWIGLDRAAYRERKERTIGMMLAGIDRRFPGLAGRVSVTDLATPATMARYTGNPDGAILGFAETPGAHRRMMAAERLPVRGCFAAGAWTSHLGGFMQTVKSGLDAARRVARFLG
jgi:prolycopene isomerase